MPFSFSFSAPRFHLPDLDNERRNLSSQELDAAEKDLYGISSDPENGSVDEAMALQLLHDALEAMTDIEDYEDARRKCPAIANDDEFRLRFLRAEGYDPESAAERMVLYWKEKIRVFGPGKAFHRLTLDDLEDEDLEVIRNGGLLQLPEKDDRDRGIMVSNRTGWNKNRNSMVRVAFYIAHCFMDDMDVQRNGLVIIESFPSFFSISDFDRKVNNRVIWTFRHVLPIRVVGKHLCLANAKTSVASLILPYILHAVGPYIRTRFKVHEGSDDQVLESLSKYGIPKTKIPTEMGGTLEHVTSRWLERRLQKESGLNFQ